MFLRRLSVLAVNERDLGSGSDREPVVGLRALPIYRILRNKRKRDVGGGGGKLCA